MLVEMDVGLQAGLAPAGRAGAVVVGERRGLSSKYCRIRAWRHSEVDSQ